MSQHLTRTRWSRWSGFVLTLLAAFLISAMPLVAQNPAPAGPPGKAPPPRVEPKPAVGAKEAKPPAAKEQPGKPAPEPNQVGEFMKAKLQHAQRVLEGLATEDFDLIAKHAQEMSLLSQAATWQVLQTPEYRDRSTEFRRAVDSVTEAARNKNLDSAALAYVDMTMKCVSCHKYVRQVRMAALPLPQPHRVAAGGRSTP